MTTKAAGGKITGLIALTLEAQSALEVGDPVMVTGDYECDLADGSQPIVGIVSVRNVGRGANGAYPVAVTPGDVTVEARGWLVVTKLSGGAITAGTGVGINATGDLVADGTGVAHLGIALMGATGAGTKIDVLVN
jgi:hypothetical protein